MIDKRRTFTMETGFTSSDFSFYKKYPESINPDRSAIYAIQATAGKELWYEVSTYVHRGQWSSETVLVLTNGTVQIETAGFGWRRVTTHHEAELRCRQEYETFLTQLSELKPPVSLRRWHSDVCGMFENEFEETLCYGDDE